MAQNIQSLWSPAIKATVLSPEAILRGQAEALALQTGGLLVAEIVKQRGEDGRISASLDLVAPTLNGSRHRILKVSHSAELLYPVDVEARSLLGSRSAYTDMEFTEVVAEVLSSGDVESLAQSLLARANEAMATSQSVQ